jgi:antitoxin component HigA of HigAB toxin-antitoxin module
MTTKPRLKTSKLPKTFQALSALRMLRPIQDAADFEDAQTIADALAVLDARTRDQDQYLESLSLLMEHYENEHSPISTEDLKPLEILSYLMEGRGMSESDLGRLLGERSLGNAVLSGRRSLSKAHIRTLANYFKVSTDVFL